MQDAAQDAVKSAAPKWWTAFENWLDQYLPADAGWLLQSTLSAVLLLALLFILYVWMRRGLRAYEKRGRLSQHTFAILRRLVSWAFWGIAILIVLQQYNVTGNVWSSLTAILAMVAVGIVAVWSVLSNAFCSIVLMISRPFNVGDTIEFPGEGWRGKVVDFNLIFTTLRDDEGATIQVPNNLFFQKPIRRIIGTNTVPLDQQADREDLHE
jgi:small-conductance mechanosensitive channel